MVKKLYDYLVFQFKKYIFSTKIVIEAEREIAKEIKITQPRIPISIEKFEKKHIDMLRNKLSERKIRIFESRMNDNFDGTVLLSENNEVAAFGWTTFIDDIDPNTGVVLKAGEKEAVFIDDFTFPEFRGNRLQTYTSNIKLQKLQDMNYKICRLAYLQDNIYSRKALLNNGFIETYKWKIIRIAGINFKRRVKI